MMLLLLLLVGCDDHLLGTHGQPVSCDRDPPLTWETFGEGFLNKHCTGCHSSYLEDPRMRENAPPDVDLDTWPLAVAWGDRIWERAIERGDMPPGGGPDQLERALLEEWLACEVLPAASVHGGGAR